ncbi:MAG: preprotein translocase subunit SecE [Bacilli bacterium]
MGFLAKLKGGLANTGNYFRDSYSELKKVRWPSRKEMISYTTVVVVVVTLVALFFAALDLGLSQLIDLIIGT